MTGPEAERVEQLVLEITVSDLDKSLAIYTALGFALDRRDGGFAALRWGDRRLFLSECRNLEPGVGPSRGNVRIIVPDVDRMWSLALELNLPVEQEIADRYYGLRDFSALDPDGFGLRFASVLPLDPSRALAADYSRRAHAYARHWAPIIHPMARPLLSAMPFSGARTILDVGSGTGGLWPLIRSAAPNARLYGVDRSEGMLRAGADILRGHTAVGDAERLPVRPAAFDAALLLFVLQHIPDPVRTLREISTALRSGGLLGVVVWGEDPGLPGAAIWAEELDRALAAPDPRDPSVMRQSLMDTPEKLDRLLRQGGLTPDRVWSGRLVHQWTVDALLATQTQCGLPSRRLESLSPESRRACADGVRARLEQLPAAAMQYRAEVIYALARRE